MAKTVHLIAHAFDCLPGHVTITSRGEGGNLRIAVQRALAAVLSSEKIRGKRVGDFKISVIVIADTKRGISDARDPATNSDR